MCRLHIMYNCSRIRQAFLQVRRVELSVSCLSNYFFSFTAARDLWGGWQSMSGMKSCLHVVSTTRYKQHLEAFKTKSKPKKTKLEKIQQGRSFQVKDPQVKLAVSPSLPAVEQQRSCFEVFVPILTLSNQFC